MISFSTPGVCQDATPSVPADLTQLSLEELSQLKVGSVYAASRHEQKTSEAPSSVSIVTADEIKKYGNRTLADVLQSVRGLFITSDRNYSYLGIRGFSRQGDWNSRILFLLDGHRINENTSDSSYLGQGFVVDVDLIDRVEVIRGPTSSLYGNNAFFGVINVITKRGSDLKGTEVAGAYGTYDTWTGRFTYGNAFKDGPDLLISGTISDSDGAEKIFFKEFNSPKTNRGYAEDVDGESSKSIFTKLSQYDFTLEGGYITRGKEIPTASYGAVFNDPHNQTVDERAFVDLKYDHTIDDDLNIMARAGFDYSQYSGMYVYDRALPQSPKDLYPNRDRFFGQWWTAEVQVRKTFFESHTVTVGTELRDHLNQDLLNFDDHPRQTNLDTSASGQTYAFYAQDEYKILKNLTLNAGVRYDHFFTFGDTVNPRAGLIYAPLEDTTIKLLYGQAFRAPNAVELNYDDGGLSWKTNPDLKPEKIKTYEIVVEQNLNKYLKASISGFYYEINDLISQTLDAEGLSRYENLKNASAAGTEVELNGHWGSGWSGRVSYALSKAEDSDTGRRLTNSPDHLAKLNVMAPLYQDKVFAGLEVQYMSSRVTLGGNDADGFTVVNFTLFSQKLLKNLELSGTLYNIFDARYGDPGSSEHRQDIIPRDGRQFRVKVLYKF